MNQARMTRFLCGLEQLTNLGPKRRNHNLVYHHVLSFLRCFVATHMMRNAPVLDATSRVSPLRSGQVASKAKAPTKPKAAPKPKTGSATKPTKAKAAPKVKAAADTDGSDGASDDDFDGKSDGAPTPGAKGLGKKLTEVGGQAGKGKSASEMYQKVSDPYEYNSRLRNDILICPFSWIHDTAKLIGIVSNLDYI